MEHLKNCWMPAMWSKDLKKKPKQVKVLGTNFVFYRDSNGTPVALEDRCPHRGVKLSDGAVISGDITCPYHGWRFDSQGQCSYIPSLFEGTKPPSVCVPSYPTCERNGLIWFVPGGNPTSEEPPEVVHPEARWFASTLDVAGHYIYIMENWVENSHANVLHGGLLRGKPLNHVTATIARSADHVRIRTLGEQEMDSLLFKLLGKTGEPIEHIEEYRAPNIMVSIYRQRGYFAGVQGFMVPVDETHTRWISRVFLNLGAITPLVFPVFARVTEKIMMQDAKIIDTMQQQAFDFPDSKNFSVIADASSIEVVKAARAFAESGPEPEKGKKEKVIEYWL
ncbi:MAG: aromatic ring-hydroxylating dioxygenase subunit alpha [Cyanobacteria bacterium P01_F01_bin.116]